MIVLRSSSSMMWIFERHLLQQNKSGKEKQYVEIFKYYRLTNVLTSTFTTCPSQLQAVANMEIDLENFL